MGKIKFPSDMGHMTEVKCIVNSFLHFNMQFTFNSIKFRSEFKFLILDLLIIDFLKCLPSNQFLVDISTFPSDMNHIYGSKLVFTLSHTAIHIQFRFEFTFLTLDRLILDFVTFLPSNHFHMDKIKFPLRYASHYGSKMC